MPMAGGVGPGWNYGCEFEKKTMEFAARLESRVPQLEPAHGVEGVELLSALPEVDNAGGEVVLVAWVN